MTDPIILTPMITAAEIAQRCKYTTVDCVTVLETTTNPTEDCLQEVQAMTEVPRP